MALSNYRKETSERSDASNWAKKILIDKTDFYFDSIEGCNENSENKATHLMERARVDEDNTSMSSVDDVMDQITRLEGVDALQRKINFAHAFGVPLTYVLYCDETQHVWMYSIDAIDSCKFEQAFNDFSDFSAWIASIKGWKSSKPYREREDLPLFDKVLRRCGCAWPTNIDCFISDRNNHPIAVLEFQNAKTTGVLEHCNNEFFYGKNVRYDQWGHATYDNDIRRWQSQEILRLQSNLRLFVITWAQDSSDYILKEIEVITFPKLPFATDWHLHRQYQYDLHDYVEKRKREIIDKIAKTYESYNLDYDGALMNYIVNHPPLSVSNRTLPLIYYKYKMKVSEDPYSLPDNLCELLGRI